VVGVVDEDGVECEYGEDGSVGEECIVVIGWWCGCGGWVGGCYVVWGGGGW